MTEESRKRRDANVKKNCGTCCHAVVCEWKGRYANEVSALVHEMQTSTLIQYTMKCKHHMTNGGCTFDLECELEADNIANGVTLNNQVSSSKWIPVTERLPEKGGRYLALTPGYLKGFDQYDAWLIYYHPESGFYDTDPEYGEIYRWMMSPTGCHFHNRQRRGDYER